MTGPWLLLRCGKLVCLPSLPPFLPFLPPSLPSFLFLNFNQTRYFVSKKNPAHPNWASKQQFGQNGSFFSFIPNTGGGLAVPHWGRGDCCSLVEVNINVYF